MNGWFHMVCILAVAVLMPSCMVHREASELWKPVPRYAEPPHAVEEQDVYVISARPSEPCTVVGHFDVDRSARMNMEDEQLQQFIRERAAAMGGNTVVYADHQPRAEVLYVHEETFNLHGGDDID